MYSNVLPEIVEGHSVSAHLYADDPQLYLPFSLTEEDDGRAVQQLEDCIEDVRTWITQNKLKLNKDKTEMLIILHSRQTHKCSISSLTIGGCDIDAFM